MINHLYRLSNYMSNRLMICDLDITTNVNSIIRRSSIPMFDENCFKNGVNNNSV